MENQTTILIVDDEAGGRQALEGVLFSQGYTLVFAENGKEAYEKALTYVPDVILLDVMMPNMDGFEVCRLMRADPLLAEVPILLVTALDDRVSRIKGIEAGADDFISKPFDRMELRARVRTITRLNRYRRLVLERARFVWVIDQAKEGYVILDAEGQIKYSNPVAHTFLSLPFDEKLIDFHAWVQKQYSREPEEAWAAWQHTGKVTGPLYLIRSESDAARPVWLEIEVLDLPYGERSGVLVRITEITEKLALYQEVWNFHKTITHKLRTPLANVIMAAELFNHQVTQNGPDNTRELSEAVLQGVKRIRGEIEEVLRYVNMPNIANSDHHFLYGDLEPLLFKICGELGLIKIVLYPDETIPAATALKLSSRSVEVILWEVLENAKKFHPKSDPVLEVCLSIYEGRYLLLSIRDDGIHLTPEQLRQVWVPYYQAEKEFSGEVAGMGLGLSTVATLLWGAGGKCRMVNREDHPGVIVDLVIPLDGAAQK